MKPYYGRLVRAEVYFSEEQRNKFSASGKLRTVNVRVYHVPTGLTLASDGTGAQAWQKVLNHALRDAEAYETVLRRGNIIQSREGQFVAFSVAKELR